MKITYLTDGPTRQLRIGSQTIILKHASPKTMATAEKASGLVIQALQHLGKENIDAEVMEKIKVNIPEEEMEELRKDRSKMPEWMKPVIDAILSELNGQHS